MFGAPLFVAIIKCGVEILLNGFAFFLRERGLNVIECSAFFAVFKFGPCYLVKY